MPGKQDGPGPIIYGPPRPPRIAQNANFFTLGPIYEKLVIIFFPCYKFVCSVMRSYCPEMAGQCDFNMFVGPWSIYIYIKCLWVLLTNVYWFRATGGYICGCGRPSNLVIFLIVPLDFVIYMDGIEIKVWSYNSHYKICSISYKY